MGKVGELLDIDFVISTGDNFYENGLTGTDDEAFEQSFTNIYTAKSLQKPWYLGKLLFSLLLSITHLARGNQSCFIFPFQFWEIMTTGVMCLHS
jgi:hypothetical protein